MNIFTPGLLSGQTAIVTGGSRGIGRAVAFALAKSGANVAIISRSNNESTEAIAEQLSSFGVRAISYGCDVSNFDESAVIVKQIINDFGDIGILVNNAGITRDKLIMQMSESDFDDVININLKGAFNMTHHVSRQLIRRKAGRIINITSVAGLIGNAGQANYAASKAGMIGLTKSTAKELAPRGITVNAIAPGFVDTDMTKDLPDSSVLKESIPLARMADAEEIANLALYLASPAAAYITGEVIRIDGGLAM